MNSVPDPYRQLSSLGLAVVLLAPGHKVAQVNHAAEQFFGQSSRRLEGRRLEEVLSFDDPRLMARLTEGDAPISARDIAATLPGVGAKRLDLTVTPVLEAANWQIVTFQDA